MPSTERAEDGESQASGQQRLQSVGEREARIQSEEKGVVDGAAETNTAQPSGLSISLFRTSLLGLGKVSARLCPFLSSISSVTVNTTTLGPLEWMEITRGKRKLA